MKRFAEQFNKKASGIRLTAAERRDLKERLEAYMEYHPLPVEMRQTKPEKAVEPDMVSEPFLAFRFDMTILRSFAGVFVLILIVVIPMMAEKSVPGDVLYPVKVQFNEEVRSSLAISPYAQVEWETERLERRLAEARLLDSEGKLTEEVEAGVAEAVKEHSDKAKAGIAKIRETDEDEAAIAEIAFASALAVQSEVLEGHVEKEDLQEGEVKNAMSVIVSAVSKEQQAAEATQAGVTPSYAKLLGRVENETTKAYELFASVSEYASVEEVANIERRLEDIERKLAKAIILYQGESVVVENDLDEEPGELNNEKIVDPVVNENSEVEVNEEDTQVESVPETLESGEGLSQDDQADSEEAAQDAGLDETVNEFENDTEPVETEVTDVTDEKDGESTMIQPDEAAAIEKLREVLVDTRKLISFMTNIDVRNNVSIDELLPVTLTDDEKIVEIKNTLIEVEKMQAELANREVADSVYIKYSDAQNNMVAKVKAAKQAMVAGELESAQTLANEALLIAEDLAKLAPKNKLESGDAEKENNEQPTGEDEEILESEGGNQVTE